MGVESQAINYLWAPEFHRNCRFLEGMKGGFSGEVPSLPALGTLGTFGQL